MKESCQTCLYRHCGCSLVPKTRRDRVRVLCALQHPKPRWFQHRNDFVKPSFMGVNLMQVAEYGKFYEAWFPIDVGPCLHGDQYLTYTNEKGKEIPVGFLKRQEAETWLAANHPGRYSLVVINAEAIKWKWGHDVMVVSDVDPDWIPGDYAVSDVGLQEEELCHASEIESPE